MPVAANYHTMGWGGAGIFFENSSKKKKGFGGGGGKLLNINV